MSYWRRLNPRGGIEDLIDYWRQPTPYRWQILGLSVAATFTMMVVLIPESERVEPKRPEVTYITTFEPGRTDEQIRASNLENQRRKDAREAELAERAERRREAYRALARASGFDPDELERDFGDDAAATPSTAPSQSPATGDE